MRSEVNWVKWLKCVGGGNRRAVSDPHEGYILSQISQTPDKGAEVGHTLIPFFLFKRYGIVKGRTCTNGGKQCKKSVPGDSTYPTLSTESILITATIDAHD